MIPKTGNKNVDLAITIGLIVVIVVLLKKVVSFVSNPLGIPEEAGGTAEDTTTVNPSKLTKPKWQYSVYADKIEDIIWGTGLLPPLHTLYLSDEEANEIVFTMKQLQNIDDIMELVRVYGNRGRGVVIQDYPNLIQTLQDYLSEEQRSYINYDYELKKINFRL